MSTDLTADRPINYADAAWRDRRAGNISTEAALLIIKTNLGVTEQEAAHILIHDQSPAQRTDLEVTP